MRIRQQSIALALLGLGAAIVFGQSIHPTLTWESPLEYWAADATFSPFGTYLASAQHDGSIAVARTGGPETPTEVLWNITSRNRRQQHWYESVLAFTPDEQYLIIAAHQEEHAIGVMDIRTGEVVLTTGAHEDEVDSVAVTPDGRWVISAGERELAVWRLERLDLVEVFRTPVDVQVIPDMTVSPDGSTLLASDLRTDTIALFGIVGSDTDAPRIEPAGRLEPHQYYTNTGYLHHLDVSPDGRWVATGVREEVTIWERTDDDYAVAAVFPEVGTNMTGVSFGPDARMLFVTDMYDFYTYALEGERWEQRTTIRPGNIEIKDIDVSPAGAFLAVAGASYGDGNPVELWTLDGLDPGPIAALRERAGGRLSVAQRQFLHYADAREILGGVAPELTAPQDMFETDAEYAERLSRADTQIRRELAVRTEAHFGARIEPLARATSRVSVPIEGPGVYDIEMQEYTVPFLGATLTLTLDRNAARDLYRNWEITTVQVVREETPEGFRYGAFELIHPTTGAAFAVQPVENPFTGERIDPVQSRPPAVAIGDDLLLREVAIDGIFPALYRSYAHEPVGAAQLANTGSRVSGLTIEFLLPGFMDAPARAETPRFIDVNGVAEVLIRAPLNRRVLTLTEGDTVTAALSVTFSSDGRTAREEIQLPVRLLNRNAIRWDDDRKVAAFMSVSDPTVTGYATGAISAAEDLYTQALSRTFLHAMRIFEALGESGITYVVDPASAYAQLSRDEYGIDFLRFPAETLAYRSGDCDDLSVLFNTLLESVGVPTSFITTPGHIYTAFDLGVAPELVPRLFSRSGDFVFHEGRTWVPVETTAIGEGFLRAWELGATGWRAASEAGAAAIFTTQSAWARYEPVGMEDLPSVQLPPARAISDAYQAQLAEFKTRELEVQISELDERSGKDTSPATLTRYGLLYARFGELDRALDHFSRAAEAGAYLPALLNAANVSLMLDRPEEAVAYLDRARDERPDDPRVVLALTVSRLETGDLRGAEQSYRELELIDPDLARRYPLFGSDQSHGRAAEQDPVGRYLIDGWADVE